MECSHDINHATSPPPISRSPLSAPPASLSPPPVVMSPCAACKILRRRCADKCNLAPYFPPTDPAKFTIAHRVFGASSIIKFLQELHENQRMDAVSSMVYEASARIRDPVYGCAGVICQLQKQVNELQAQLAKAQAEVVNMQSQQANLLAMICMEMAGPSLNQPLTSTSSLDHLSFMTGPPSPGHDYQSNYNVPSGSCFNIDDNNVHGSLWEPLWT